MSARPIRVFISYAHANRDVVERLLDYLGVLKNDERIEVFEDRQLIGGEEWDPRLKQELARADLIILVVTAKFLSSAYCAKIELKEAIRRRENEGIVVMPIIAETCPWTRLPLARLQALPFATLCRDCQEQEESDGGRVGARRPVFEEPPSKQEQALARQRAALHSDPLIQRTMRLARGRV